MEQLQTELIPPLQAATRQLEEEEEEEMEEQSKWSWREENVRKRCKKGWCRESRFSTFELITPT